MARPVSTLQLSAGESAELQRRLRAATTTKRDHVRAEIILLRAQGMKETDVASRLGISLPSVSKWSRRFEQSGIEGLKDQSGRGRKVSLPVDKVRQVITKVTQPPAPRTRWSVRSMAAEVGISPRSVHRIWQQNDLKPHLTRTFKISKDPAFEQKFWDVIGLYLHPPDKALVLCCDEKSQCQALERTQPGLPLGIGHIRTQTHDYRRHGTVTLFAALNYLEGKILGRTEIRHTHVEWLRFLRQIDRETPKELQIHLILDNYCTHKHKKVRAWIHNHKRFQLHFTPTGGSWMNLVERFFGDLTREVVREGSFASVRQLVDSIMDYLAERNMDPRPYRWRAKGEDILARLERARAAQQAVV
jgi:transposase